MANVNGVSPFLSLVKQLIKCKAIDKYKDSYDNYDFNKTVSYQATPIEHS